MSRIVLENDGSPGWSPEEEVLLTLPGTRLVREVDEGLGRLFVTSQRVAWVSDNTVEAGLCWHFREIALHAIARGSDAFPRSSIYCQLAVEGEGDDEENIRLQELRLVPSDDLSLAQLFDVLSQGAAMNPDPMDESDGDEEMPDFEVQVPEGFDTGANFDDAEP
jgi:hypothetical protein